MSEVKFKINDQWYYVASQPDGSCQGGLYERVPNVFWPFLEEIDRLKRKLCKPFGFLPQR